MLESFIATISAWLPTLLIAVPLLGAAILYCIPSAKSGLAKSVTYLFLLIEFALGMHAVRYFNPDISHFQFSQLYSWFPAEYGINIVLGFDGLSLLLVIITTVLFPLIIIGQQRSDDAGQSRFLGHCLALQGTFLGAILSLDIVLFYVFWEAMLIPALFMLGIWGNAQRGAAALRFFIFTAVGSLLMLVAFAMLYYYSSQDSGNASANITDLYNAVKSIPADTKYWMFGALTLAFAIKTPLFPFHSWQPTTYRESSQTAVTLFAAILSKAGLYGILRFSFGLFPEAAKEWATVFIALSLIGIIYGAFIAWKKTTLRGVLAYSSLSHLGFIFLGFFLFRESGYTGGLFQIFNHAVVTAGLFILVSHIERTYGTSEMNKLGGIAKSMPAFATFFVIVVMGSVAVPGTGSFIGEWLILFTALQKNVIWAFVAGLGVIFGAAYMLRVVYYVIWGPASKESMEKSQAMGIGAAVSLALISVAIIGTGFGSRALLDHSYESVTRLTNSIEKNEPYGARLRNSERKFIDPTAVGNE